MAARKKKFKVTYSKVELKIPTVQKRRLKAFCKTSNTTINKVYRKAIREFIDRYAHPTGHTQMKTPPQPMRIKTSKISFQKRKELSATVLFHRNLNQQYISFCISFHSHLCHFGDSNSIAVFQCLPGYGYFT